MHSKSYYVVRSIVRAIVWLGLGMIGVAACILAATVLWAVTR